MDSDTERRREAQIALAIVQQHPQASGEELDALIKDALQLRTTPMARMWRILAQDIYHQSSSELKGKQG